jgi:Arc/MetJ-type ribon-helix-helix transcriptional regulator
MERAALAISLPRTKKDYILAKLQEGGFSTPSESIRSLIRDQRDLTGKPGAAVGARRGILEKSWPERTVSQPGK